MRSGNGRHRRPRQAPAFVVTAGATGAGLALPLLGASGVQAADAGTWDRVAECESGGLWSADEGNGYYGGLQLTVEMWQEYGGREFAEQPDFASRAQQITVAERILAGMGAEKAWPECAGQAGLNGEDKSAPPEVDPGADLPPLTEDVLPEDRSQGLDEDRGRDGDRQDRADRQDREDRAEQERRGGKHRGELDPREESGEWGDAEEAAEGTGRHRADDDTSRAGREWIEEITEEPQEQERDEERAAESDAKSGDGADGAEGVDGSGEDGSADGEESEDGKDGSYTVRPGDTLSEIAREHSLTGGWSELYDGNKNSVGTDPDTIKPGQNLELGRI